MNDDEMLETVREFAGASELYRVHRFTGSRTRPGKDSKQVLIEVFDRGPGPWKRWHIEASHAGGITDKTFLIR
jgi:hypothetical protein